MDEVHENKHQDVCYIPPTIQQRLAWVRPLSSAENLLGLGQKSANGPRTFTEPFEQIVESPRYRDSRI